MFQIISGTSKTVSGTQNVECNVPNTAHTNVPTNSVLFGTLFLLVFPVSDNPKIVQRSKIVTSHVAIIIHPAKLTGRGSVIMGRKESPLPSFQTN